ncbi:unnamed protein product [Trichobilharzia regenti]|nr:unnamed protein product [Trichobilharzia regenti]
MNSTESLSEDDLNLCSNSTTTKSIKSMNAYRKLHNSNSLNSDPLNSFSTDSYYSDLNNKGDHCSGSSSSSISSNSIHHKNDFMKYSNDIVDSSYSQSDENNPLMNSTVNSNLELSRFNNMQNENSGGDNNNDNNDETNENDDITPTTTINTTDNNNINATNATKYDYSSSHGKGKITSSTPKTHSTSLSSSSSSNLDYPTEFSFNTDKFTNYSNYFTEFNKNEITERQDKQSTLSSTQNANTTNNNNNSSGFDDRDHEPNRLHSKLMSEINEPAKKLCYSFNSEGHPTDIRDNQSVKNTVIMDKSYLASFQNTKIDELGLNSITLTNNENFKLYNNNNNNSGNQASKSPLNDSSLPSPGQTNSQRMLNAEGATATSLLEWRLTSENNNFIAKIKSDHNNNNNNNEQLESNSSNSMFTNLSMNSSFMNNPIKNNDNTDNTTTTINHNNNSNSKDGGVYEEKLSTSTDRHSPPLSYSSQSTENLNDESIRGGNPQHASYLHPPPLHQHTDKLCSDVNNEFIWKTNPHPPIPPPGGDLINYENEISYIKNRWNTNHHLLMNKLRFSGNLSTTNSGVFTTTNNSNNNNEMNYPEQNLTDTAAGTSNRSNLTGFDSMIPCISHNFLTNFTRTPYDGGQNNCLQENLYDLSSSSHHLNSHNSLVGGFTNPANFFSLDSGSNSSTISSSHPVSTSSSDHNRLDDVYDRTEQCLGLSSLSQQHNHHHHHHHHQFMMMNNNCASDYNMNLPNDVTMATGSANNDFKTGLNYYLLPPVNGFTTNTDSSSSSLSCQITNGGITSNFKNRLTASTGGYSSQNFTHSNLLSCNHSNTSIYRHPVELDYNPRELEAFSELFKQRRIKLGVTQADVGKALGNLKISGVGSLSQSTICRFESLTLSHNNMIALKPVLQAWLEEAEAEASSRSNHPSIYDLEEERRRKRTSITDSEKRSLEAFFSIQPRPSSEKISQIAEKLNLKKNVVRVWFCNQRQKQKRMKFSTLGMLHHSATRT